MSDDQKPPYSGFIADAPKIIEDLIKMGKTLGIEAMDWAALMLMASQTMQKSLNFKIQTLEMTNMADCQCEKCKARRAREGFHVVN